MSTIQPDLKYYHLCHTTNTNEVWQIHKADCADVSKMFRGVAKTHLNSRPELYLEPSAEAVQDSVLGDPADEGSVSNLGYDASNVRIMPCCKDATGTRDKGSRNFMGGKVGG